MGFIIVWDFAHGVWIRRGSVTLNPVRRGAGPGPCARPSHWHSHKLWQREELWLFSAEYSSVCFQLRFSDRVVGEALLFRAAQE